MIARGRQLEPALGEAVVVRAIREVADRIQHHRCRVGLETKARCLHDLERMLSFTLVRSAPLDTIDDTGRPRHGGAWRRRTLRDTKLDGAARRCLLHGLAERFRQAFEQGGVGQPSPVAGTYSQRRGLGPEPQATGAPCGMQARGLPADGCGHHGRAPLERVKDRMEVGAQGLEPWTCGLKVRCSTN